MSKPKTEDNRSRITSDPSRNLQPSEISEALNSAVQYHNASDLARAGDASGFCKPNPTRFAHSENYVLLLARDRGFNVVYSQPVKK